MKKILKLLVLACLTAWVITYTGCKKDAEIPTLTTTAASDITSNSGVVGGNVTDDRGAKVIGRSICWNTSENPKYISSTLPV